MSLRYVESIARTNRLHCGSCSKKIKKGQEVVFELESTKFKPMENVYCEKCGEKYQWEVSLDEEHPFSSEALGQF